VAAEAGTPLPDRILKSLGATRRPSATIEQLRRAIGASAREIDRAINELENDGAIVRLPRKRIALTERSGLLTGTVKVDRSGRALVILDVPDAPLSLGRDGLRPAMDRDRVLVEETPYARGGLHHAKIRRVLERGRSLVMGVASKQAPNRILPLDPRIGPYLVLLAPQSPPGRSWRVASSSTRACTVRSPSASKRCWARSA
jgi:exoribonuclease R